MLSDEEIVLKRLKETLDVLKGKNVIGRLDFQIRDMVEDCIRVIEKQSKEIEELTDKNKKLKDKAKELIFEKQELTSALLDSTPNDKIKVKIDEVDKDENASIPDFIEYAKEYATQKLQSLLEKE